jgi:hypothetical protein
MAMATLDASLTPLESVQDKKDSDNKNKFAEAEALAAEALRMANEAKLAAARLAEVKKTLSMFSNKLEKAEQSVQKDENAKVTPVVVKEDVVEEAAVVEVAAAAPVDEDLKADPPSKAADVVSKNLVNDDVVKVVVAAPVVVPRASKEPVEARKTPAPVAVQSPRQHDIVEDFFDGIGVDRMCGVDDETLGFTDRPAPKPEVFENPTRIVYKTLSNEEFLHGTSLNVDNAVRERQNLNLPAKQYQRKAVNEEFNDPFGVDHDDLVLCGKIADLCEPEEFEGEDDYDAADDVRA